VFAIPTVHANEQIKSVTDYGEGIPAEWWAVQQVLDSVTKNMEWRESDESLSASGKTGA
jgi:hypothetical protein